MLLQAVETLVHEQAKSQQMIPLPTKALSP
jgi:hypothetical protein